MYIIDYLPIFSGTDNIINNCFGEKLAEQWADYTSRRKAITLRFLVSNTVLESGDLSTFTIVNTFEKFDGTQVQWQLNSNVNSQSNLDDSSNVTHCQTLITAATLTYSQTLITAATLTHNQTLIVSTSNLEYNECFTCWYMFPHSDSVFA